MSALANQTPIIETAVHTYDADAFAFSANLQAPTPALIDKQAYVELPITGGYKYLPAEPYRINGIVSHGGGYTQVGGHANLNGGATTLATAVIVGLNILDVVTADRIVAQITTEHAPNNYVPSVSFLGTRFENLRIAGQQIEVEPYLDILGAKPNNDESYLNDGGVLSRIAQQYSKIRSMVGLPKWASDRFNWDPAETQRQQMKCSLVKSLSGAPGKSFGNVIDLPFFGKIYLAELTVTRKVNLAPGKTEPGTAGPRLETSAADASNSGSTGYQFTLTMINAQLNGGASGQVTAAQADPNGTTQLPPPKAIPRPGTPPGKKQPADRP